MNRSKSLGIALASVLVIGGGTRTGRFRARERRAAPDAVGLRTGSGQANTCSLTMATYPDSVRASTARTGDRTRTGSPTPMTTSSLPANTTIDMTIDQYDSGGSSNNAFFDQVMGTIGGTATIDGKTVTHVDPNDIGTPSPCAESRERQDTVRLGAAARRPQHRQLGGTRTARTTTSPSWSSSRSRRAARASTSSTASSPAVDAREGQFGEAMSTFGYMSGTFTVN